jgi:transcriptional regulator with XRE-family HTH domain
MPELRDKGGLTQVEVSQRTGLPQSRVSELERGARVPNLLTMIRIAVALERKFADLASAFDKNGLRFSCRNLGNSAHTQRTAYYGSCSPTAAQHKC